MNLLKSDPLQLLNLSKECGLDPPWKSDAGNKQAVSLSKEQFYKWCSKVNYSMLIGLPIKNCN